MYLAAMLEALSQADAHRAGVSHALASYWMRIERVAASRLPLGPLAQPGRLRPTGPQGRDSTGGCWPFHACTICAPPASR